MKEISLNPNTRQAYFHADLLRKGFAGKLAYVQVGKVMILLQPNANAREIRKGLFGCIREINREVEILKGKEVI